MAGQPLRRPPWSSGLDAVESDDDSVEAEDDSVENGDEKELAGARPPRSSPRSWDAELSELRSDPDDDESCVEDGSWADEVALDTSRSGRGGRITSGAGVELTACTVA